MCEFLTDAESEIAEEPYEKSRVRAVRRYNKQRAYKKRCKIIDDTGGWYNPLIGWYAGDYTYDYRTQEMRYVGKRRYLKYPRNSKPQRYLKRDTSKRMRRIPLSMLCGKSNIHRKIREYWWDLY